MTTCRSIFLIKKRGEDTRWTLKLIIENKLTKKSKKRGPTANNRTQNTTEQHEPYQTMALI